MKGDFTRFTFDPRKDYAGTLMQQGRVQLDSDWNEQQAIHRHLRETTDAGIIGRFGVPKGSSAFAIGLAAGGADLSIGQGRAFLAGAKLESRGPATLLNQPFLQQANPNRPGIALPTVSGRYIAYLEAWDRHVTADRDPLLRETALGGPDTTTRIQPVWQVRLVAAPSAITRCADLPANWSPTPSGPRGSLAAATPGPGGGGPCVLPPTAGYRALDNQLYRVEVHRAGLRDGANPATVKWSRDNGSVATTVTVSGQTLTAATLGPDEVLGFAAGQWVELIDEWMELAEGRGRMLRIRDVDPATRVIEIEPSTPVPAVDATRPVMLVRWDQTVGGTDQGLPIGAAPLALEAGLQVSFGAGAYAAGEYWLIPARTAIGGDTGMVEWPREGGNPAFLPAQGPLRQQARLALVDYDTGTQRFTLVEDCRPQFPPLTDIDATDVGFDNTVCGFPGNATTVQRALDALCARGAGHCTLELAPGDNLQAMVDRLLPGADARICLRVGLYSLAAPLVVAGKGHVVIEGCGEGTRLVAARGECALWVTGCASLTVRDCAFEGTLASDANDGAGGIMGALTIDNCLVAEVMACSFTCAPAGRRAAAGLAIRNPITAPRMARVNGCRFAVGHMQQGLLVLGAAMLRVEDNVFAVAGGLPQRWLDARWAGLADLLVGRMSLRRAPPAPRFRTVLVNVASAAVSFTPGFSVPGQVPDWQGFVNANRPPQGMPLPRAGTWFHGLLTQRFHDLFRGSPATTALDRVMRRLLDVETPAAADGILVTGIRAEDIALIGNRITGALRGIRVTPLVTGPAGRVRVEGNTITLGLTPLSTQRIGIQIGHARSIRITGNRVDGPAAPAFANRARAEGVRVFGRIGLHLIIRDNHVASLPIGFSVTPLPLAALPPQPQWVVTDNIAERAQTVLATPSPGVRSRLRGANENYA